MQLFIRLINNLLNNDTNRQLTTTPIHNYTLIHWKQKRYLKKFEK